MKTLLTCAAALLAARAFAQDQKAWNAHFQFAYVWQTPALHSLYVGPNSYASLDVQRISNPGYNADRGNLSVCSVQLHCEH